MNTQAHICTYAHTHAHAHIRTHAYTHPHTHTSTYILIRTHTCSTPKYGSGVAGCHKSSLLPHSTRASTSPPSPPPPKKKKAAFSNRQASLNRIWSYQDSSLLGPITSSSCNHSQEYKAGDPSAAKGRLLGQAIHRHPTNRWQNKRGFLCRRVGGWLLYIGGRLSKLRSLFGSQFCKAPNI